MLLLVLAIPLHPAAKDRSPIQTPLAPAREVAGVAPAGMAERQHEPTSPAPDRETLSAAGTGDTTCRSSIRDEADVANVMGAFISLVTLGVDRVWNALPTEQRNALMAALPSQLQLLEDFGRRSAEREPWKSKGPQASEIMARLRARLAVHAPDEEARKLASRSSRGGRGARTEKLSSGGHFRHSRHMGDPSH